ncbi:MAG: hypothetical protein Q9196_006300, partial [Gyalolechia fulgens]
MRFVLGSALLSLPLATLAALEGGGSEGEPTTTLSSTSTMTLTRTLGQSTITATMSDMSSPGVPSPILVSSSTPAQYMTPVPSFTTSPTAAPYPIPGPNGAVLPSGGTGTAATTGTGVAPGSTGIVPFVSAATNVGSHNLLATLGGVVLAG